MTNLIPGLKHYKSHKDVWAAKILAVEKDEEDQVILQLEGKVSYRPSAEWLERFNPQVGSYLVQYKDGYLSVSPAQPFEEGNALVGEDRHVWVIPGRAVFSSEEKANAWIAVNDAEAVAFAMVLDPR